MPKNALLLATVTVFLVGYTQPTRAEGSVNYCHSLAEIAKNVRDCGENVYFAKAAQVCLGKIERDIETKKALLTLVMQASGAAAGSAQAARIENNSHNLADLRSSIEELSAHAVQARREVSNYSLNLDLAGPFNERSAEKIGILKLLRKFPCYKDNRSALAEVVTRLDNRITEFSKVIASARELEVRSTASMKNLETNSLTRAASNRSPAALGAPRYASPPPVAKKGPSSITGTEKIGESERALQRLQK